MSTTTTTDSHSLGEHHAEHHEPGLIGRYIFSRDHKVIGMQFLFTSLFFLIIGGLLALAVRHRIAWPEEPVPFLGTVDGAKYATLFTMHASVMIFFVIIPVLVGAFGNFIVPLHIGARDMAFPFLNGLSYWIMPFAGIIMFLGFWLDGGAAAGGWTSYPPLSVIAGAGQTCWCLSLIIVGSSSIMGAVNYITTIVKMRAPGMTFHRMSLTVWSVFITSILVLFGTPVLTSALILLLLDRHAGTTFFSHDGQPLLWQHLFWFYSHPAVYIMILPAMGIVSDVIAVFARKPIFGYRAMAYSMVGISGLGYIVWGHHMFQSGMNPKLGTAFMMSTMLIALPSAVKTFNWLGTLWGGNIKFTTPMLNALAFVSMFVIGGLSGIFMAATPVDIHIHDTYFIVAHIHYVLFGGTLFGVFAGIYFWFPKMFGRMMNETLGKIHFILSFIAFNCTFFPMHIIGAAGLPRRYAAYAVEQTASHQWANLQPYNIFITYSAIVLGLAQIFFFANFIWSLFRGKKAGYNPWNANTLEWTLPSPPAHGNYFPSIPVVYRGPYEYNSPVVAEDYLPQSTKLDAESEARERQMQAHGH
jgi:cytochrome c oxidase subunit 1